MNDWQALQNNAQVSGKHSTAKNITDGHSFDVTLRFLLPITETITTLHDAASNSQYSTVYAKDQIIHHQELFGHMSIQAT